MFIWVMYTDYGGGERSKPLEITANEDKANDWVNQDPYNHYCERFYINV